jgi:hypothetical protein
MSLESLLTKVDEATWKQYEKVTNWAYKNYGWSKYELATMCGRAEGICFTGYGTYLTLNCLNDSSSLMKGVGIATGATCSIVGGYIFNSAPKRNKQLEQAEKELAIYGVTRKPEFGKKRPLDLLIDTTLASIIASLSYFGPLPKQYGGTIEEYRLLGVAMGVTFLGTNFCRISADYFSSQLPKPPKAKKSVWQALSEPITKYFRKAVHQMEPKPEGVK